MTSRTRSSIPALVGVFRRMVAALESQLGGDDQRSSAIASRELNERGEPAEVVLPIRRRSWLESLIGPWGSRQTMT